MAKKKQSVPEYGTVTRKGTLYYRIRITDADGKQVSLYATTCEEFYMKSSWRPGDRWMRSSFTESIQRLPSIVRNGC